MQCDMCGSNVDFLKPSMIEGVEMKVCATCSKYGTPIKKKASAPQKTYVKKVRRFNVKELESKESIVENYDELIRKARQKAQLPQKALAIKLAEKESVIHALETGKHEPSIALARRIGKLLNITLVEETQESDESEELLNSLKKQQPSNTLTLGDVITIRKRK
jgi:putative transcription factor